MQFIIADLSETQQDVWNGLDDATKTDFSLWYEEMAYMGDAGADNGEFFAMYLAESQICDGCGQDNLDHMLCPNSHRRTCVDCCPCHKEN